MSGNPSSNDSSLSLSIQERIDRLSDRFEAACKIDGRPKIEDFLDDCPEAHVAALFRELLNIDLAYRRRKGEDSTGEEYEARFPDLTEVIAAEFNRPVSAATQRPLRGQRPAMKSDTQATHNLMRRFYENLWQKEMGKLAALRVAQLSIVDGAPSESADCRPGSQTQRHPRSKPGRRRRANWAACVLSGDPGGLPSGGRGAGPHEKPRISTNTRQ